MDYTVGSVADLISQAITPNKPKVIKRELPKDVFDYSVTTPEKVCKPSKNLKKEKSKRIKDHKVTEEDADLTVINHQTLSVNEASYLESSNDFAKSVKKKRKSRNKPSSNTYSNENEGGIESNSMQDDFEQVPSRRHKNKYVDDKKRVPFVQNPEIQKDLDSRTIFVGNVAVTAKKIQLLRYFGKYGKIQSVRLRNITPDTPGISKRLAGIKKMLHPKRTTLDSYIIFENREDALKALAENGSEYKGHHLRVQICDDLAKPDVTKAVFVGNLPFDIEDDDLWTAFEMFGTISSVRIVRNSSTGMGIGIGYVNFISSDSVELALHMGDVKIKKQSVRIDRCRDFKKNRKEQKHQEKDNTVEMQRPKKHKQKQKDGAKISNNVKSSVFQGVKSDKKKKKPKPNKGANIKKRLSNKVAPWVKTS